MNEGTSNAGLFGRACQSMPGGVNSPVRAFSAVGGTPRFLVEGCGAVVTDVEGKHYLDYTASWGPLILGHAHPRIVEAVREAAGRGMGFGACHPLEIGLVERIRSAMPHLERVRLVNSGTEAMMSAVRLARAVTGRERILKFEGCYHGHADPFLIAAGSGAMTHGHPSSPGVTRGAAADTLLARYNDLASVDACLEAGGMGGGEGGAAGVAAVVVEPVAGNMGLVLPEEGFLQGLRERCDRHGALLVFDEVITGFRLGWGGAAVSSGVVPDLTALGKIIGGGLPVGAYGGKAEWMDHVSPVGAVYQAGTLSGNPVACAAGCAALDVLREEDPYPAMRQRTRELADGLRDQAHAAGVDAIVTVCESMFTLFFGIDKARSYADVSRCDADRFARYNGAMLAEGVYWPPSQFETCFVSAAHTGAQIEATLAAQKRALEAMGR